MASTGLATDMFRVGDRVVLKRTDEIATVRRGRGFQSDGVWRYLVEVDGVLPTQHPDGFPTHPKFFGTAENDLELIQ